MTKSVLIAGGGVAGITAALYLSGNGYDVHLVEKQGCLGGRASSFKKNDEYFDTGQHILLRCCQNLLNLYRKLGTLDKIKFYSVYNFLTPDDRYHRISPSMFLPVPLHFLPSILLFSPLKISERVRTMKIMWIIYKTRKKITELPDISFQDWLVQYNVTEREKKYLWGPILIGALNAELPDISARDAFFIMKKGFFEKYNYADMGISEVPLTDLYKKLSGRKNIKQYLNISVREILFNSETCNGVVLSTNKTLRADNYILAMPPWNIYPLIKDAGVLDNPEVLKLYKPNSITTVILEPKKNFSKKGALCLPGGKVHWIFKSPGSRRIICLRSASGEWDDKTREYIFDEVIRELGRYFTSINPNDIKKIEVLRMKRATFIPTPGLNRKRPGNKTLKKNLYLAGDWTDTGWPSTMESAVISGKKAARLLTT